MKRWYVIYTQARGEERALWHLRNQGFHCFLPRFRTTKRHARKTDVVLEPLFPRYIFAQFDQSKKMWRSINGTRGVVQLLTDGTRPLAVPGEVIDTLLAGSDENGVASLTSLGVVWKGMKVHVKTGPFAGQKGEVADVLTKGRDRVLVLLSMLGVEARVPLPSYAVETA
ncbi:MAG: transcriptional activator RfaH [Hyphomicrobiaceae bacterium]|nr:transcriptional activator RfaH [Hyphomicrobiaceae bacterium]